MKYALHCTSEDVCVRPVKDTHLRLEKKDGRVEVVREKVSAENTVESIFQDYPLKGRITAENVRKQLANVRHIGFEVTDGCNLKCTYCAYGKYYNDYDVRTGKKMGIRKAKVLIDDLWERLHSPLNESAMNEVMVSFYGGEPLLNFEFIQEMVHYTQQKQDNRVKFNYVMTTNAVYLKKYFPIIHQYDFRVMISLDGSAENDGHRVFPNGSPSFDIVYNTIKYIQDNYPDYFEKKITFNAVIHNKNNVQEIFDFFQREFGKIPSMAGLNPSGVNPELANEFECLKKFKPFTKDERIFQKMEEVMDLNFGEVKVLQDFIFRYSGNTYMTYEHLLEKRDYTQYIPTATCIPFSKRVFMTVNNKLFPCERIGHQYALGEVTDNGVQIDCTSVADRYNEYYESMDKQCSTCLFKVNCSQCMFSIKGLDIGHPQCDQWADASVFQNYLKLNLELLAKRPELYQRIMKELIWAD